MWHEMIIAAAAVMLILLHFRSAFVICVTLPLAVLFAFLTMWLLRVLHILDVQANIMSMAGITISIGILVDQAIVMVENATHQLKEQFGDKKVTGDTREIGHPRLQDGRPADLLLGDDYFDLFHPHLRHDRPGGQAVPSDGPDQEPGDGGRGRDFGDAWCRR